MDSVATPAAAAQPDATPAPVLTAVESAVVNNDVHAFREARRAERSGTPAPAPAATEPVQVPPTPATATVEEPRTVSKRQHEINERIRVATERAVAAKDAEIAQLRSQLPAGPAAPRPAAAAGETFPTYATYLDTHPDASLEDYIDARQDFRDEVKTKATRAQRMEAEQTRSQRDQVDAAITRTQTARAADPALDAKFTAWEAPDAVLPEILTIPTRDQAMAARIVPRAEHDFATAIATSEYSAQIIAHVADHPDVLAKVRTLDTRAQVIKFVGKLETRFERDADAPTPAAAVVPKTVSSAPAPATTLGSRPASAADPVLAAASSGDVSAFRAAKRAREAANRR